VAVYMTDFCLDYRVIKGENGSVTQSRLFSGYSFLLPDNSHWSAHPNLCSTAGYREEM